MATRSVSVIVLGAGIAGSALSYHLARRHTGPVVLFDPATPAAGATGRAAGIVTDQLWNEWDVKVAQESATEYRDLCARHDPMAFTQNGFLRWTASPVAAEAMEVAAHRLKDWGVSVDLVGHGELEAAFPWGRFDDIRAGLRGRTDAVVTPSTLAEIYVREARALGVEASFGSPMTSLSWRQGGYELTTGPHVLRSPTLVVAAGAWSKQVLLSLGRPLPLVPYRTQAATLRPANAPPLTYPSGHDIDTDVYFRPEGPGRVVAGDGTESIEADPDRFQHDGDERFLVHLAESFESRLPGWASAELVRAWAGVCTATPDRRPLVGAVPGNPSGLFVIAGFNGFGVMRAGAVARRLADLITEGPEGPAQEALAVVRPGRFADPLKPFPVKPGFTLEPGDSPRF